MDGMIPMRHCTLCGKHMTFEGAAELAGTAIVRLVDPIPNQVVNFFSCECGRIESIERERCALFLGGSKPSCWPTGDALADGEDRYLVLSGSSSSGYTASEGIDLASTPTSGAAGRDTMWRSAP
jgi:hypothetical protein